MVHHGTGVQVPLFLHNILCFLIDLNMDFPATHNECRDSHEAIGNALQA